MYTFMDDEHLTDEELQKKNEEIEEELLEYLEMQKQMKESGTEERKGGNLKFLIMAIIAVILYAAVKVGPDLMILIR